MKVWCVFVDNGEREPMTLVDIRLTKPDEEYGMIMEEWEVMP